MSDKRQRAKWVVQDVFRRLIDSLILHPTDLQFEVLERNVKMTPGLCIVMVPHRGDFTRIYGKMRRNYDALETIAVSIGLKAGVPILLGRLGENGPGEFDRSLERFDWSEGREKVLKLLSDLCAAIFFGTVPIVESLTDANGEERIRIRTTPADKELQRCRQEALQVLVTAMTAKYYVRPTVELVEDLP